MERFLKTRHGIIASSPRRHSRKMNTTRSRPAPTNSPMIVDEFHGRNLPTPHCSARKSEQMAPIITRDPSKSKRRSLLVRDSARMLWPLSNGSLIQISASIPTMKPAGRFLWQALAFGIARSMENPTSRNTISIRCGR